MRPFFSIIIPTFNRACVIKRAIDSIVQQDFQNFDLWVIDDGPCDDTEKTVANFQLQYPQKIHYRKTSSQGVSAARNFGVEQCRGPWIAFLDSDDEWKKNKLSLQASFIADNPHIQLVHGEEIWMKNHKRINPHKKHQKHGGRIFLKCLPLCLISPSTVVVKRELFEEMKGFDQDFPVCEDYDLWLRITSLYEVGFVEEPIVIKHGGHPDQLSQKYKAMDYWRVLSLDRICQTRQLDAKEIKAVSQQIIHKGAILLNGYKKHGNLKNHDKIHKIVEDARINL